MKRNNPLSILFVLSLIAFISCENVIVSTTPTLTSISPSSKVVHMPSFSLTAKGKDFIAGAKIIFDGHEISANYVSSTQLSGTIPSEYIATSGGDAPLLGSKTVEVYVKNPQGSDSSVSTESGHLTFTISNNYQFGASSAAATTTILEAPELVIDKNDKLFLFYSKSDGLYFITSTNLGSTWSSPLKLNSGQPGWIKGYSEDSNIVDLVWARYGGESNGLVFTRTTDGGSNWSAVKKIDDLYPAFGNTDISADQSGVLLATWFAGDRWANLTILVSRSSDHGSTWSWAGEIARGKDPHMIRDTNGKINMAFNYISGSSFDIAYTATGDSGWSWIYPPIRISSGEKPVIVSCVSGYLYCFYLDSTAYNLNVKRSTDGGTNWGSSVVIAPAGEGLQSTIETDSAGNLNAAFTGNVTEETDDYRIYSGISFWRSIDYGSAWNGPVSITGEQKAIASPGPRSVMTSNGTIIVAWAEAGKNALNTVTIKTAKSAE